MNACSQWSTLPHAHSWRAPNHKLSSGRPNLWSSSVRKFPLFQQLGPPVLARESMNNNMEIYQNLKTDKLNAVRTWRGEDSEDVLRNTLKLWFYPEERKAFALNAHLPPCIFIVTIIPVINSTDWKTWTMANKIHWQLTYGGSLLLGPGSSLETIPFPWQRWKKFWFPLRLLQSRY